MAGILARRLAAQSLGPASLPQPYVKCAGGYADARIAPGGRGDYRLAAFKEFRSSIEEVIMNVVRWDPFASLGNMFGRMPALARWPSLPDFNGGTRFEWSPSADISGTEQEYLIRAELPVVKKEDVHVTFDDGMLTVSGERRRKEEEKKEKFHRLESFYGSFCRSFSLPENVDSAGIRADSKDGIVTIHVPKSKATAVRKSKEIKVQ
jgi:HSP20 family protein